MRSYRKWVMTLGIVAAAPQVGLAGAFGLPWGNSESASTAADAGAKDQQVADAVAGKLKSARLRAEEINIEVQGGKLTLRGRVADSATKAAATSLAQQVEGVTYVNNLLATAQPAASGPIQQVSAEMPARPNSVQSAAFEAPAGHQQPQVQQVAAARDVAQQARNAAPAAPAATQQSRFTPPPAAPAAVPPAPAASSQDIANSIAKAMAQNNLTGVNVSCQNGSCTLTGSVVHPQQIMAAMNIARSVPGVKAVQHQLQVAAPGPGVAPANFQPNGAEGAVSPGYAAPPTGGYQPNAGYPPGYGPGGYGAPAGYPPSAVTPPPPGYGQPGAGAVAPVYENPSMPQYAWPTTAAYPNYSAVAYPQQYSASAWPYIGPFYPYPQVPLGWRKATLEWDDGQWYLDFNDRTDRWWWFLNPKKW